MEAGTVNEVLREYRLITKAK